MNYSVAEARCREYVDHDLAPASRKIEGFMRIRSGIQPARSTVSFPAVVLVLAGVLTEPAVGAGTAPDFSREVRPTLEKHCLKCHGPEKQKGGLRFDTRDGAFKTGESGEKAIVPEHASKSRLIKLISSKDPEERMPSKA